MFCGAGGASMGYHLAGFDVVGVDIAPQPRYPFEFQQADAMEFPLDGFDVIHASPPCQAYSANVARMAHDKPRLIEPLRERLMASNAEWVIENVVGAPLHFPLLLCGAMFGLNTYRHRLFETGSFMLRRPRHPRHDVRGSRAGHWVPGERISVAGNCGPIDECKKAMGIDWMTRKELCQAIPPAYTKFVGTQLLSRIKEAIA
jgi:DNA (cytosine-5)-methyltransferase 1